MVYEQHGRGHPLRPVQSPFTQARPVDRPLSPVHPDLLRSLLVIPTLHLPGHLHLLCGVLSRDQHSSFLSTILPLQLDLLATRFPQAPAGASGHSAPGRIGERPGLWVLGWIWTPRPLPLRCQVHHLTLCVPSPHLWNNSIYLLGLHWDSS